MEPQEPRIQMLSLRKLIPFPNHPFQVRDDASMKLLEKSIIDQGVLHPIIVRPSSGECFEIISGHRRVYACTRIGMDEIPAQVVTMDQDSAEIAMVDSNLHREHILPSEKAYAYAIKMNAMKRQGRRPATNPQEQGARWRSACILGDEYGESEGTIRRYIRLTKLIPAILKKVDEGDIAFTPALELTRLSEEEQKELVEYMETNDCAPSLSQAALMKKLSRKKELTIEKIESIMEEPKARQRENIAFKVQDLRCFFPDNFSTTDIQKAIIELLTNYQRGESNSFPNRENDNTEVTVEDRQNSKIANLHGGSIIDDKKIMNMKDTILCAHENGIELSKYTLRRAILSGRIPCRHVGRKYMIMWGNVLNWLHCEDGGDADQTENDHLYKIPPEVNGESGKNTLL